MASRRNLKKKITNIASDLFLVSLMEGVNREVVCNSVHNVIKLIIRISHTEPGNVKGFYYIAQGAGLPIILVAIDYAKKCITAEKVIHPSGDLDKDMREIKLYYKNFKGKYPENFSIGKVE